MGIFSNTGFLSAFLLMAFCISAGYIMRKKGILNDGGKQALTAIIYKLSVPCLTFTSFMSDFSARDIKNGADVLVFACVFYALWALCGYLILRKRGKQTAIAGGLLSAVGQLTLFTIPLLRAAGSEKAVLYCNMMTLPFRITVYCVAFSLICLSGTKGQLKKVFLNPIMISMLLGLFVWVTQDAVPVSGCFRIDRTLPAVYSVMNTLADMLCPLAMILVGINLGESDLVSTARDRHAWTVSILRTMVCPLSVMLITHFIGLSYEAVMSLTLGFAAPCSVTIAAFCSASGHDTAFSANCVALSTLMCVFTIPALNALLSVF